MTEEMANKFISNYGIGSVVVAKSFADNICRISIRGGYSILLEVVNGILYKDGEPYFSL